MPTNLAPYSERLKHAVERAGIPRAALGRRLAERTGRPSQSERRAVYKYLDDTEPDPERAAHLAAILDAPELARVQPLAERRHARRAELEARVADLEARTNEMASRLEKMARQVSELEKQAKSTRRRPG